MNREAVEAEIDSLRIEAYDLAQELDKITEDMNAEIDYCLNRAHELEKELND